MCFIKQGKHICLSKAQTFCVQHKRRGRRHPLFFRLTASEINWIYQIYNGPSECVTLLGLLIIQRAQLSVLVIVFSCSQAMILYVTLWKFLYGHPQNEKTHADTMNLKHSPACGTLTLSALHREQKSKLLKRTPMTSGWHKFSLFVWLKHFPQPAHTRLMQKKWIRFLLLDQFILYPWQDKDR